MKINCQKCKKNCCGGIKNLTPILLPFEEIKFKKYARKIKTPYRSVFILKRKKNGKCVFFDEQNKNCSIYNERLTECKIYPYLFYFENFMLQIKLDERFCRQSDLAKDEHKKILKYLRKIKFPKNWVKADKSRVIQKQANAI